MKVHDLVNGKGPNEMVNVEGLRLPAAALYHLMNQGYENIRLYGENRTFSVWGKNCTACFNVEHLLSLAESA